MIPSDRVTPRKALTQKELKDILAQVERLPEGREKLALTVLLFIGARKEELLGLRWDDFDFDERFVHIQRAVTHPGKTLQSMAGHAEHQVTMNVYVHPKKENVARAG